MHASTVNGLMSFLAIVESGSINRAAVALNLSQPALTRTLQQFEARVGAKVLTRSSRGIELTAFGEILAAHARTIQQEIRAAEQDIRTFHGATDQQLKVGVVMVHPLQPFCRAVIDMTAADPQRHVQLTFGTASETLDLLRAGRVEMVLGHLIEGHEASDFVQDKLADDEVAIYCRAGHALAGRADVRLEDLAAHRWVLHPPDDALGRWVHGRFAEQNIEGPDVAVEIELTPLRRAMVLQSDYISPFQFHHVAEEVAAGRLVRVDFDLGLRHRPIGTIRIGRHSKMSKAFLQHLAQHYLDTGL